MTTTPASPPSPLPSGDVGEIVGVARAIEIVQPKIRFDRPNRVDGDMAVFLDDFEFVTIHYDYRYTHNSMQWRMAEQIARMLGWEPDTALRAARNGEEGECRHDKPAAREWPPKRPSNCANPMDCGWHEVETIPPVGLYTCFRPVCQNMPRALSPTTTDRDDG